MNLSVDTNLAPLKKKHFKANDVISIFVHVLSFERHGCAILRTFETAYCGL